MAENEIDLLYGYQEIGAHLGLSARQVEHLTASGRLPLFNLGRRKCALKSKLDEWLARQAARPRALAGGDQ